MSIKGSERFPNTFCSGPVSHGIFGNLSPFCLIHSLTATKLKGGEGSEVNKSFRGSVVSGSAHVGSGGAAVVRPTASSHKAPCNLRSRLVNESLLASDLGLPAKGAHCGGFAGDQPLPTQVPQDQVLMHCTTA